MKILNLLFVIIFFVISNIGKSQQWTLQNSGTIQNLYAVQFVDINNGWAVGNAGTILHTTNGGTTWSPQVSGVTVNLKSVFFVSTTVGWVVGIDQTILHTINGGTTWTHTTGLAGEAYRSVYFINQNVGWIGGTNVGAGYIIATTDGGQNWIVQTDASTSTFVNDLFFLDANNGWAIGTSGNSDALRTSNGGNFWFTFSYITGCPTYYDIFFIDTQIGVAVGDNSLILSDGGSSCFNIDIAVGTSYPMHGVYLFDYENGLAVGENGLISKSINTSLVGWEQVVSPTTNNLLSLCVKDNNHAWAVGSNGTIIKGTNLVTSISENKTNSFSVYPNSFSDFTTITLGNKKMLTNGTLELTDLTGRVLRKIENLTCNTFVLNKEDLTDGMYLLVVYDGGVKIGSTKILCN
ncbi:MAG: T9SS type A sorting domain-containing protein [Bacteroidia bacterium]|nr:T9SS type A sorting domain-containing protein [Bacteroidia bacterium]